MVGCCFSLDGQLRRFIQLAWFELFIHLEFRAITSPGRKAITRTRKVYGKHASATNLKLVMKFSTTKHNSLSATFYEGAKRHNFGCLVGTSS